GQGRVPGPAIRLLPPGPRPAPHRPGVPGGQTVRHLLHSTRVSLGPGRRALDGTPGFPGGGTLVLRPRQGRVPPPLTSILGPATADPTPARERGPPGRASR